MNTTQKNMIYERLHKFMPRIWAYRLTVFIAG